MKKITQLLMVIMLFACATTMVKAQKVGLKTNFLYWATTTPNLGVEMALGNKWTLDLNGGYNGWEFDNNKKFKHFSVLPEVRYWTCEAFNGHFFGLHGLVSEYNVGNIDLNIKPFDKLKGYRYEGWAYGVGLTYGYQFVLSKHWNLEASISGGYVHTTYDKFNCEKCGKKIDEDSKNYFGPTKATISIIYLIK
ncbi:DUF3575 domain-containing protein [Falsiporphyromonas endometrii]|uniref:DUF3575 domain-containing protein n=1 Tax=Falsiporphyromonas endometrii TaxID=1387297 RepID=A0ABV9K7H2_9PORP